MIKSLQKGLMKGAKKLQALVDRILQKFKFKRFKLERKGKRLNGAANKSYSAAQLLHQG
ncbi:hypothetical protein [Paenibacillus sp. sgz5001063]|uniref:hypothetical protein n=1 Tax=Paenibacillus sp. sgz5001063 TaxID=3242474 RepID=UPI0036D39A6A